MAYFCPYPWLPVSHELAENGSAVPLTMANCTVNLGDLLDPGLLVYQVVMVIIWLFLLWRFVIKWLAAVIAESSPHQVAIQIQRRMMGTGIILSLIEIVWFILHPCRGWIPFPVSEVMGCVVDFSVFYLGILLLELWVALATAEGKMAQAAIMPHTERVSIISFAAFMLIFLCIMRYFNYEILAHWCSIARDTGIVILLIYMLYRAISSLYVIDKKLGDIMDTSRTAAESVSSALAAQSSSTTPVSNSRNAFNYDNSSTPRESLDAMIERVAREKLEKVTKIRFGFRIKSVAFILVISTVLGFICESLTDLILYDPLKGRSEKASYSDGILYLDFCTVYAIAGFVALLQFQDIPECPEPPVFFSALRQAVKEPVAAGQERGGEGLTPKARPDFEFFGNGDNINNNNKNNIKEVVNGGYKRQETFAENQT